MAQEREITRVVTGKSTVPEFETLTGTLTTNPVVDTVVDYTGALTAQSIFGADLQRGYANNLYIYENTSTHGTMRRIVGLNVLSPTEWSVQIESAFATPLAAEDLKIVKADLADYSVANTGNASGYMDGFEIVAGETTKNREDSDRRETRITRVAKTIDGTGTTLKVLENI